MKIKALSLWQPWATLMAEGIKKVETRSWTTDYRGPLAIHATKAFPREAKEFAQTDFVSGMLKVLDYHIESLPCGAILAIVDLDEIVMTELARARVERLERELGDYSDGRFAWFTNNLRRLCEPRACWLGKQKLWDWEVPPELEYLVK
jgi:hypothetical protein